MNGEGGHRVLERAASATGVSPPRTAAEALRTARSRTRCHSSPHRRRVDHAVPEGGLVVPAS